MSRKKLQQIEKLDGQTSIQQQVSAKMKQQRSLLDVMYEESLQDEKARRRSLAFYIGYNRLLGLRSQSVIVAARHRHGSLD